MPLASAKVAAGEVTLKEFEKGVAYLSDGSTVEFPTKGVTIIEQDPEKPAVHPMFENRLKPGVLLKLDCGVEIFLIRGAQKATVLKAVERINKQV